MKLSIPHNEYALSDQVELRRTLELEDRKNHKRGQDVEIGDGRLVIQRPSDGARFDITVDVSGNVIATAI